MASFTTNQYFNPTPSLYPLASSYLSTNISMYRLTANAGPISTSSRSPPQNFSHPRRARSPVPENGRRPRSPAMQTVDDPLTCGAPSVQKSQPIRYAGSSPTSSWDNHASRRPLDRSARSASPLRSERPPAHIRAQTPPAPAKPFYNDRHGFLAPPPDYEESRPSTNPPSRAPSPLGIGAQEARGRGADRSGLRSGMAPGPNFYEQSTRRTNPLKITTAFIPEALEPKPIKQAKPAAPSPQAPAEVPAASVIPKAPAAPKPRKHVPSMCDYLSLEQLEDMWSSQDMYKGTIEAPQSRPRRLTAAQIMEARAQIGDLPVHPAFRDYPQMVS